MRSFREKRLGFLGIHQHLPKNTRGLLSKG
jgi:hypothetical protein